MVFFSKWETQLKGLFGYCLLLKTENWKHYNKIIFKGVNSTVRPNFKVRFTFFCTCRFCKQYMMLLKNTNALPNTNALVSKLNVVAKRITIQTQPEYSFSCWVSIHSPNSRQKKTKVVVPSHQSMEVNEFHR